MSTAAPRGVRRVLGVSLPDNSFPSPWRSGKSREAREVQRARAALEQYLGVPDVKTPAVSGV
jgi:hypothetical protein